MKKLDEFLNELKQLSEKYEMFIGGCGCCDSPYINCDIESNELIVEFGNLYWNHNEKKYEVCEVRKGGTGND